MRIGVISRGSPDYLIDIVTDGLIRQLGRQNVAVDYNVRFSPGGKGAYYHLCQGFDNPEPFDIHDADALVASTRSLDAVSSWKTRTNKSKIAIVDGEDLAPINAAGVELATIYFKREYFHFTPYPSNVRPLPFAAVPEDLPVEMPSRSNVFYSGHPNHPFRNEIVGVLKSMGYAPAPNQDKKDYNKSIMGALVGVAIRGMGWDTYRYWEIPYFGAALLAQRPGHVIPANFIDGEEACFYDHAGSFRKKLTQLMSNPEHILRMAAAGHKALLERHMSVNRARTVLESLV